MKQLTVKDFVDNASYVCFTRYRAGFFYYNVTHLQTAEIFEFPVPIEDIGNSTLNCDEKAITFMRWIRKAIEDNTMIQKIK